MNGPYSKSSGSGPLAAQAQAAVARKPTALERMVSRVTLLTLQEKYHDNCHVLRVRGFAAMGLLALGAIAAAGTLAWLSWALPVLPAMLLALWLAAEIWFYVCNFIPRYRELNRRPTVHRPSQLQAQAVFDRFLALQHRVPDSVDANTYLQGWFLGAPCEQIKQGNLEELIAYGFWYCSREELEAEGKGHILRAQVERLQRAFGIQLPPGYTPGLRFMSHLWEDLRVMWRPLAVYVGMETVAMATSLVMRAFGFTVMCSGGLKVYVYGMEVDAARPVQEQPLQSLLSQMRKSQPLQHSATGLHEAQAGTWYQAAAALLSDVRLRGSGGWQACGTQAGASGTYAGAAGPATAPPHTRAAVPLVGSTLAAAAPPSGVPILFLHGVGGLPLYVEFIKCVAALGNPVIAVEFQHVSLRLSHHVLTMEEMCEGAVAALDALGIQQAAVVAHSVGTFIASRLVQTHKKRLHSLVLIDPVCLGMFLPQLLHTWVYRIPRFKQWRTLWFDLLMYFASKDLQVAAFFGRRFYWSDVNLWPEDMPPNSVVLLSGGDDLVAGEMLRQVLESMGIIKVLYCPDLFHGGFLLSRQVQQRMLSELSQLLSRPITHMVHSVGRTLTAMSNKTAPPARQRRALTAMVPVSHARSRGSGSSSSSNCGIPEDPGAEELESSCQERSVAFAAAAGIAPMRRWSWAGWLSRAAAEPAQGALLEQQLQHHEPGQSLPPPGASSTAAGSNESVDAALVAELRSQIQRGQARHSPSVPESLGLMQ